MLKGQVSDIQFQVVTAFIGADLDASHRQVDTCHEVLLFDLQGHLFGRRRFPHGIQASGVERGELVAGRGDDALDGLGKTARPDRSPVVVPETNAAPNKVIRNLQIIVIRAVEVRQIDRRRIRKGQVADRIEFGEGDHGTSPTDLRLHRRGSVGRNEQRCKGAQQAGSGDIELRLELVKMLVTTLCGRQVHEIPGKERIWKRHVGVNPCGCQSVAI